MREMTDKAYAAVGLGPLEYFRPREPLGLP